MTQEFKTARPVRLDQLQAELETLLEASRLVGLSAQCPGGNEITLVLDLNGSVLTPEEERAVLEAVAGHVPDETWGSDDEETLRSLLARPVGSLTTSDLELAIRRLVDILGIGKAAISQPAWEE